MTSSRKASVRDASRSTLMMCACVVLFSGFTSLLLGSGLYGILAAKLARTGLFSPFESAAVLAEEQQPQPGTAQDAKSDKAFCESRSGGCSGCPAAAGYRSS